MALRWYRVDTCLLSGELVHEVHDDLLLRLRAAARLEPFGTVRAPATG